MPFVGKTACSRWSTAPRWWRSPATTRGRTGRGLLFEVAAHRALRYSQRMDAASATGLEQVQAGVARACKDAGRDLASVTLVAVSKTFPPEAIEPVIGA